MADLPKHNQGTDLMGFPAGEALRLQMERIARANDPKFDGGPQWDELKANAERSKQFLREVQQETTKIPEAFFVQNFLHPFAGLFSKDPVVESAVAESGLLYRWIQIAGMPYRPVNVHKDTNPNRILFTVPPVFRRTRTIQNLDPGVCFLSFLHKAQQVHSRSPEAGTRFYNEALEQFAPRASREHFLADQVQWLVIFDHYEIPLWDSRTQTYKTVKELKALDGIKLFTGQPSATLTTTSGGVTPKGSRVEDMEDF